MKSIGILGGVGPQTTAKVYLELITGIRESGAVHYPSITIYNLPFPFVIEDEAIIQGINVEKMIPYLIEGAKILEKSGVDYGILPCNTLHAFIEEIRSSVSFPFLSILEETTMELNNRKIQKVGILASETTIQSKIYEEALKNRGIEICYPTPTEQDGINTLIVDLLQGKMETLQKEKFESICNMLYTRGIETILLACTDLQLIAPYTNPRATIIDTTEILISASLREMGA